jgi:hypothetical protein
LSVLGAVLWLSIICFAILQRKARRSSGENQARGLPAEIPVA